MSIHDQIEKLEERLCGALPLDPDDDGTFGSDGSHEELMGIFERAFDRADGVARNAINLLKEHILKIPT